MATSDLDFLLVEYEQKKRNAEFDLQRRKQKLYEKFGFKKISIRKKYYNNEDAYIYEKVI